MSLLRDIQSAAVDPQTDITTLLRKCKILSARLGNEDFKRWVDCELNGYDNADELPEYRILHTNSFGHFRGAFNSGLDNAPIPPSCLPAELRELATTCKFSAPISSYASLINPEERHNAKEDWPADVVAHFAAKIYQNMNCLAAWKVIPHNFLVALVDTVKTRVLSFALEIETEAPEAGEAAPNEPPLPQEKVSQVFYTQITGNVHNLATGSSNVTQIAFIEPGNFESLRKHLSSHGLGTPDLTELDQALSEDAKAEGKPALGKRVQAWIGKMIGKAASGTWKITTSAASTLLGKALSAYLGLD